MKTMLVAFTVKNYRSIVETTLNMSCSSPPKHLAKERVATLISDINENQVAEVSPIAAIYGRNASGKSNFLSALLHLKKIVKKGSIKNAYDSNKLQTNGDCTEFLIRYTCPTTGSELETLYTYQVIYNETSILKETLCADQEILYMVDNVNGAHNYAGLCNKDYPDAHLEELRKTECLDENSRQTRLLLSWLAKKYTNLNLKVFSAYDYFISYVHSRSTVYRISYDFFNILHDAWPVKEQRNTVLKQISEYLANLDTGITNISYNEQIVNIDDDIDLESLQNFSLNGNDCWMKVVNKQLMRESYFSEHINDKGERVSFPISRESAGTNLLFSLLVFTIYAAQRHGSLVVIDELDRSLHPLLLKQFLTWFTNPEYNKNETQLIFTLHDTELLSSKILFPHEFRIIEKNNKEGTKLKRLCNEQFEFIDLRNDYLQGAFAGIPYAHI